MRMSLGENMVVTLFGESHGPAVGALIEGMPPNIDLDADQLVADMIARRPGSGLASKRKETDEVEIVKDILANPDPELKFPEMTPAQQQSAADTARTTAAATVVVRCSTC